MYFRMTASFYCQYMLFKVMSKPSRAPPVCLTAVHDFLTGTLRYFDDYAECDISGALCLHVALTAVVQVHELLFFIQEDNTHLCHHLKYKETNKSVSQTAAGLRK